MGASVNTVILIGRLGRDPEVRWTQGAQAVAELSVATDETWGKGEDRQKKTEWHRIVAWGKLAEICQQYLHKGSLVYIAGRLQTRQWEDKDGNKRQTTEVVAHAVQFLDGRGGGDEPHAEASAPAPTPKAAPKATPKAAPQARRPEPMVYQPPPQDLHMDDIPFWEAVMRVRLWTQEEDQALWDLRHDGHCCAEIGRRLGRSTLGTRYRYWRLIEHPEMLQVPTSERRLGGIKHTRGAAQPQYRALILQLWDEGYTHDEISARVGWSRKAVGACLRAFGRRCSRGGDRKPGWRQRCQ
jgi:single-strand DNA-binding protein